MSREVFFKSLFEQKPEEFSPEKKPGFLGYVTDVPVGIEKGASQAVQGLLTLGAIPIDYLADTNLISAIGS